MVAIVTGLTIGVERSSGWVLGSKGQFGDAAFGQYGENVYVNAANGNLTINRSDEILIGRGPDDVIARTYNSCFGRNVGPYPDDNGDNWRLTAQRCVVNLTGTENTAGSLVNLSDWDGSSLVYAWDATVNAYVCRQGALTYNRLTFANSVWTWTDGRSGVVETYTLVSNPIDPACPYYARLTTSTDADGNQLTYAYSGNLLSSVTTADGAHTDLIWSGNNLQLVATYAANGSRLTHVRYGYDDANRLSTVTTDLTPGDNVVSDGNAIVTTYTYVGASKLVASIRQTGGAELDISYDDLGRVASLAQVCSGGRVARTTISYNRDTCTTTITDAQNQVTKLTYDVVMGYLLRAELPPAELGAPPQVSTYTYNANGDVTSATDASGNTTNYIYDANDNLTLSVDSAGNAVIYTYNSRNQLLTETHFVVPAGSGWIDQVPVAVNDSITVRDIGSAVKTASLANDYDPDGAFLKITSVSASLHGIIAIVDGGTDIRYTRTSLGADHFTYTVMDAYGQTSVATVDVANSAPNIVDANAYIRVNRNGSLTFDPRTNYADGDGDPLTIIGTSQAAHGTVVNNGGTSLRYVPETGYSGNDFITCTISDGAGGHVITAVVRVLVNSAPAAGNDPNFWVYEGTAQNPSSLTFDPRSNDLDPDGDLLTIVGVTQPSQGTVYIRNNGTAIEYRPNAGYYNASESGYLNTPPQPDTFTYTIDDGYGHQVTATVSMKVVNRAPTIYDVTVTTNQDETATIDPLAHAIDPEGDVLHISRIVDSPSRGAATITQQSGRDVIIYTPNPGANGSDQISYEVTDNHGNVVGRATIYIINRRPTAVDDSVNVDRNAVNAVLTPLANDSDPENDPLSIVSMAAPMLGTARISDDHRSVLYTPTSNYSGNDTFTYTVTDGNGHYATATMTVLVNSPPVAVNDVKSTIENSATTLDPRQNDMDPDGDTLTITRIFSQPAHGAAVVNAGGMSVTYTPASGYYGPDSFVYEISDGKGHFSTAVASLNVTNRAPVAGNDGASTYQNSPVVIYPLPNDSDPDGDTVVISRIYSQPGHGTAVLKGNTSITYTPASGFCGTDSFVYEISDLHGNTSVASITVSVINRAPTANSDSVTVYENRSINFTPLSNDSDPDGDGLSISWVGTPAHGTATNYGSSITYTPFGGYAGSDIFYYQVSDGHGNVSPAAAVYVNVISQAPTANSDVVSVYENSSVTFDPRTNDTDPDGDALTITRIYSPASHGSVVVNGGTSVTYWPAAGYAGSDCFSYEITDGRGNTTVGTVYLSVINRPPTANYDCISVDRYSSVTFDPRWNDSDPEGDLLTIDWVSGASSGQVAIVNGGTAISYTPTGGFYGSDSFSYEVNDGHGNTSVTTVYMTVNFVNHAPYVAEYGKTYEAYYRMCLDGYHWSEWEQDTYWFTAVDPDGDPITATADSRVLWGWDRGSPYEFSFPSDWYFIATLTLTDSFGASQSYNYRIYYGQFTITPLVVNPIESRSAVPSSGDPDDISEQPNVMRIMSSGVPTPPEQSSTTRYVYDDRGHIVYAISPEGEVTEYQYNGYGEQIASIIYRDNKFTLGTLSFTDAVSKAAVDAWVAGISDKSSVVRTDTTYDFRGNVNSVTSYSGATAEGMGTGQASVQTYVYDQYGNLLSRQKSGTANGEVFCYDGLGRVVRSTDVNNATTNVVFADGENRTVVTLANGLVKTSLYNAAGALISYTESGAGITTATATYAYDNLGNLRIAIDATGTRSYYLYDAVGRKVADIASDGEITEYRYDASDRLVATIRYATRLSAVALASLMDGAGNPADVTLSAIRPAAVPADIWSWRIYDSAGNLIETVDGDGDATMFAYDGAGNLVSTTSYATVMAAAVLDGFKTAVPTALQVPEVAPGRDNISRNFYDGDGRLVGSLDGEGYLSQIVYNGAGQKIEAISFANTSGSGIWAGATFAELLANVGTCSRDVHTRIFYDGLGRVKYTLDASLRPTEFFYDAAGNVIRQTEYAGPITDVSRYSFAYVQDQIGTLSNKPDNRTNWYVYNTASGRLDYSIDACGGVVKFDYDAVGNIVENIRYATLRSTAISPSQADMDVWAGENSTAQDRILRTVYDVAGRLVYTVDSEGYVTEQRYDAAGRTTSVVRYADVFSVGDSVTQASLAAQIGAIPSTAVQTSYSYDADGRMTDSYDGLGVQTHIVYDALGRISDKTIAYATSDASTVHFVCDAVGRVVSQTAAYGSSDATTTSCTYDGLGNVLTRTDARGSTTSYTYDALGHVLTATVPLDDASNAVTAYTYNAFGDVSSVTDARLNTTYFYYDELGRQILQIDAEGYATATAYLAAGNELASVTRFVTKVSGTLLGSAPPPITSNTGDATTRIEYDRNGRVVQVWDAEGYCEQYTLNAFGDRIEVVNKLGGHTCNTFDARGLLISETLSASSVLADGLVQAEAVTNKYAYDGRGNCIRKIEAYGLSEQRTTNFIYDKLGRQIGTTSDQMQVIADDLTTRTVIPRTAAEYDAFGNLIKTVDAAGVATFYYYDHLGRKIGALTPNASTNQGVCYTYTEWVYDANNNVTTQRTYSDSYAMPVRAGGTPPAPGASCRATYYTYDRRNRLISTSIGSLRIGEYGAVYSTGVNTVTTSNVYDAAGNVVRRIDERGNALWYWYDKLGRKLAQLDQSSYLTTYALDGDGNVVTERRYAIACAGTPGAAHVPEATASGDDRITNFTYDKCGRRLTEQRESVIVSTPNAANVGPTQTAVNATITYTYNGLGEVTSKAEATGDIVTYLYDVSGRQIAITGTAYTGETGGMVQARTWFYYNGLNNLTRTEFGDALNGATSRHATTYTYDVAGNMATMTAASGAGIDFTTTYAYDILGRLKMQSYSRLQSDGTSVQEAQVMRYDAAGHVVYHTMAYNNGSGWSIGDQSQSPVTEICYDALGEMVQRVLNGVLQETYDYDEAGRLWRSTSGDGTVKFYISDAAGNHTLTIASDGKAMNGGFSLATMSLDSVIDLLTSHGTHAIGSVDVAGLVVTITQYDQRGQAIATIQPRRQLDQTDARTDIADRRTYNAFGEIVSEVDARGNVTAYTYNTLGKVVQRILPTVSATFEDGTSQNVNPVFTYFYDASGRLIGTCDPNGNINTQTLLAGSGYGDTDAVAVEELHADGGRFTRCFDVFGNLRKTINEIGSSETYTYDALGRLTAQAHAARADGTQLIDYYTYDGLGQRIAHWNSRLGSGVRQTTDYDSQGRIVKAVEMGGAETDYVYTWNSAITTAGIGMFGGWIKTTVLATNDQSSSETMDGFGRLVGKTDCGGTSYTYTYDFAAHQIAQTSSAGQNLRFTYYNTGMIASLVSTQGDPGNCNGIITTARYAYDACGNRTFESEVAETYYTSSSYDPWGHQVYYNTGSYSTSHESATVTWDALNRMASLTDTGYGGTMPIAVTWKYDLNSNVRERSSRYYGLDQSGGLIGDASTDDGRIHEDDWYRYDSMNRFVTTKGELSGGTIVRGLKGLDIAYDAAGQRIIVATTKLETGPGYYDCWNGTYSYQPGNDYYYEQREIYSYTADGYLEQVHIARGAPVSVPGTPPPADSTPTLIGDYTRDAMGRTTDYVEYQLGKSGATYSRSVIYRYDSTVDSDIVTTLRQDPSTSAVNTYVTRTRYTYDPSDGGSMTGSSADTYENGNFRSTATTVNTYAWTNGPQLRTTAYWPSGGQTANTSTYHYDSGGSLTSVDISDGAPRTITYVSNVAGEILKRDVTNGSNGAPHELHYYFNGAAIGDVTNNGTSDTDYVTSTAAHTATQGTGIFANGGTTAASYADFEQSYDPINGFDVSGTAQRYTVQAGDTLAGIANVVWGDAGLWYLIADANGLSANTALVAGQSLLIPAKVHNLHNNATTYKVYDPNKAIGDTAPSVPRPQPQQKSGGGGCGIFGAIILVIVAVVVTVLTAGALAPLVGVQGATIFGAGLSVLGGAGGIGGIAVAAVAGAVGSMVSQGIGVATGLQSSFNWGAVGIAAIGGGVGALGGGGGLLGKVFGEEAVVANAVVNGMAANALTQGIAVATGLQKKFDWAGVAAAGIGAGVMSEVGGYMAKNGYTTTVNGQTRLNTFGALVSGMAGDIANAATRSLINGSDFGDNIMAALPDTIGQTIGNMVADGVSGKSFRQQLEDAVNSSAGGEPSTFRQQLADAMNPPSITNQAIQLNGLSEGDVAAINNVPYLLDDGSIRFAATIITDYLPQMPANVVPFAGGFTNPETGEVTYNLAGKLARQDGNGSVDVVNGTPVATSIDGPTIAINTKFSGTMGHEAFLYTNGDGATRIGMRLWDMDSHSVIGTFEDTAGDGTWVTVDAATGTRVNIPRADINGDNVVLYAAQSFTSDRAEQSFWTIMSVAGVGQGLLSSARSVAIGGGVGFIVGGADSYYRGNRGWQVVEDASQSAWTGMSTSGWGTSARQLVPQVGKASIRNWRTLVDPARVKSAALTAGGEGFGAYSSSRAEGMNQGKSLVVGSVAVGAGFVFNYTMGTQRANAAEAFTVAVTKSIVKKSILGW